MRRSRNIWTGRDCGHHGLPMVGCTAHGGETHGRAPPGARPFVFFFEPFRLPAVFALFLSYNTHVPRHLRHPIHPLSNLHINLRLEQFLGRERGGDGKLQGFWSGFCDRKGKVRIWMSNSSLLFSFLISSFIFCKFDLNTYSFDLGYYVCLV